MACLIAICMLVACTKQENGQDPANVENAATSETGAKAEDGEETVSATPSPTPEPSLTLEESISETNEYAKQDDGWEKYLTDNGITVTDEIREQIENPDRLDTEEVPDLNETEPESESKPGSESEAEETVGSEAPSEPTAEDEMTDYMKVEAAKAYAAKIAKQHEDYNEYLSAFSSLVSLMRSTPMYNLSDYASTIADYEARLQNYQAIGATKDEITDAQVEEIYNSIKEAEQKLKDKSVTIDVETENKIKKIETMVEGQA